MQLSPSLLVRVSERERKRESAREKEGACVCVCARAQFRALCSVASPVSPPSAHPNCVSFPNRNPPPPQPHPSLLPLPRPPLLLNHQNGLLQAAQEGLLMVAPSPSRLPQTQKTPQNQKCATTMGKRRKYSGLSHFQHNHTLTRGRLTLLWLQFTTCANSGLLSCVRKTQSWGSQNNNAARKEAWPPLRGG